MKAESSDICRLMKGTALDVLAKGFIMMGSGGGPNLRALQQQKCQMSVPTAGCAMQAEHRTAKRRTGWWLLDASPAVPIVAADPEAAQRQQQHADEAD